MKFKLKDFLELDTKSLFAVNGGSDCGGSSSSSGGSEKSSGASHSKGSGTYSVSGIGMLNNNSHTSSSSSSSGGSCSGSNVKSSYVREFDNAIVTEYKDKSRKYEYEDGRIVYYPAVDPKGNPDTSTSATAKGGYCSGASDGKTKYPNPYLPKKEPEDDTKDDDNGSGSSTTDTMPPAQETNGGTDTNGESKQPDNKYKYQVCSNPSDVHCDIIAWNHAVDAGLNPMGSDKEIWDGNELSVDQIFDEHYAKSAREFNSDCAGLEGYLFYDWDGADINGEYHYEHMEFCKVSSDGSGYSYFSNEGMESGEVFKYNIKFSEDPNAHARNPENGGKGHVMFVPLNN